MIRTEVIQKILDKKKASTYLEIGVDSGDNFFPIKVREKIAVDPNFTFSKWQKTKWYLKNPCNRDAKYYRLVSDNFFADVGNSYQPDIVFIDGLHTYQQSLKDVNNSLGILNKNGVIIIHDCNPPHEAAAFPANCFDQAASSNLPGWAGVWCGDVWKTLCHLRSTRKDLRIFVLDCDFGLGIITKGKADDFLDLSEQDIAEMTYEKFSQNREQILNLKSEKFLYEYLESI